jgi:hypothetical protein
MFHGDNIKTDAFNYSKGDQEYILTLYPIRLKMKNQAEGSNDELDHILTLGISYLKQDYLKGVD